MMYFIFGIVCGAFACDLFHYFQEKAIQREIDREFDENWTRWNGGA